MWAKELTDGGQGGSETFITFYIFISDDVITYSKIKLKYFVFIFNFETVYMGMQYPRQLGVGF